MRASDGARLVSSIPWARHAARSSLRVERPQEVREPDAPALGEGADLLLLGAAGGDGDTEVPAHPGQAGPGQDLDEWPLSCSRTCERGWRKGATGGWWMWRSPPGASLSPWWASGSSRADSPLPPAPPFRYHRPTRAKDHGGSVALLDLRRVMVAWSILLDCSSSE